MTTRPLLNEIREHYALALDLLHQQRVVYNPSYKDPYNVCKIHHTEFNGKDEWPDEIIFQLDQKVIFAQRQSFKGKKTNLFAAHRKDGPAICEARASHWAKDGKFHRENGPAWIWFKFDYTAKNHLFHYGAEWCNNGQWHRLDGPAILSHKDCGNSAIIEFAFYENHKFIKREIVEV